MRTTIVAAYALWIRYRLLTVHQEEFPALFFLDFYTLNQRHHVVPTPKTPLSDNYYLHLGNREQLRYDIDTYFTSVHLFFPIGPHNLLC
jgi:hypothetical protein